MVTTFDDIIEKEKQLQERRLKIRLEVEKLILDCLLEAIVETLNERQEKKDDK